MELEKFLQSVQEAYASLLKSTLVIFDRSFIPVTKISGINDLTEFILSTFSFPSDLIHLRRAMWVDTGVVGVKALIAPVAVQNESHLFIWAGVFIEKGMKRWAEVSLREKHCSHLLHLAEEISLESMQEKLEYIEQMANICKQFLQSHQYERAYISHLQWVNDAIQLFFKKQTGIENGLKMFQKVDPSIEFVAYAKRVNEHKFLIQHTVGEEIKRWRQLSLHSDDPFIKFLSKNKQPLIIENAATHLLLPSFFKHQSRPLLFLAYPLMVDHELHGILFAGSFHNKYFSTSTVKEIMQVAVNVTALHLQYEKLISSIDRHLMRLSILNDMSNVMRTINNAEEMLHIITDLVQHLISSRLVVIFIGKQYSHIKNNHLLSDEQLEDYIKHLRTRYVQEKNEGGAFLLKLCEAPFGLMVEAFFSLSEKIKGVLAVHVEKEEGLKEAEVYVTTLLTISQERLKQLFIENIDEFLLPDEGKEHRSLFERLTKREIEVLKQLMEGYSNREIAKNLFISIHTVKNHVTNIFQKLGVTDRAQLIAMVYKLDYMNSRNQEEH
jgi:DNA-binding CsgD family transcriptional regulator/GAF domain-containing protein